MGHVMQVLGLSRVEEEVYRHFLRNPADTEEGAGAELGMAPDVGRRALERLLSLGLLRRSTGQVHAVEPSAVVPRLADAELERLLGRMRGLADTRGIVSSLESEGSRRGRGDDSDRAGIERLGDLSRIRERIDELAFFSREEVLSVKPDDRRSPEYVTHARPIELRCLRRGVRMRGVVAPGLLGDRDATSYLSELAHLGAEVRMSGRLTELLLVYDRRTAVLPADTRDLSRGVLVTREQAVVDNAVKLFERLWEGADRFPVGEGAPVPTASQRLVLHTMCTVPKDEVGARRLGVSLRTYRRHVAEVVALLGADNRVQAALAARDRGWVPAHADTTIASDRPRG
ncbi:helix-turn-helix transcriptional regulator [Streptomyces sp. HSG2]|uniref:helix-turn-helix transcriptional regulator n=1 Tax=Streptomyces sp. HSG2 TaxID=2797167 RepID=UPI001F5BD1FA|nr:helix-turn-helix transcriptional regulator [Streptomyces sp. HSG2]